MIVVKWGMVGELQTIAHVELTRRVRQKIPKGGFFLVNAARKWATVQDDQGKRFRILCGDVRAELGDDK